MSTVGNNTRVMKLLIAHIVLVIIGVLSILTVPPCYAYEVKDGVYYACPNEAIRIKTAYDPDVSGNVKYTFSGCDTMSVSGTWPNYSIRIEEEGIYHIVAKSNTPFLLNNEYHIHVGHDWNDKYTVDKKPTCTENGTKSIHCKLCNATKDAVDVLSNGHTWENEVTIDVPATCTKDGLQSIHCENCDAQKNIKTIDKLGHDLIHHRDSAPYLESGWIEYDTCSRCDFSTNEYGGGYGVWVFGRELSEDYFSDERGAWTYDAQTSTLTVCRSTDQEAINSELPCIFSAHDLVIDCAGYNFDINCKRNTSEMGIYAEGNLTIRGGGSLYIQSTGNEEFCAACAKSVTIDGTRFGGGITGANSDSSFFTGIFADNIRVVNSGKIGFGFGQCKILMGLWANDSGTVEINKGEVSILHSMGGCATEQDISCGLLRCINGKIQTSRGSGNGFSMNADRIEITSDFALDIPMENRWAEAPIYYPYSMEGITINEITDQEYTGNQIKPNIDINYKDYKMPTGDNEPCIVEFTNNIRTGEAQAIISFYDIEGNEVGNLIKTFRIVGCEHQNIELVKEKLATCTSQGNIEYYKCQYCDKAFTDKSAMKVIGEKEDAIPATGHAYNSWITIKAATETSAGLQSHKCALCGKMETRSIAMLKPSLPAIRISKPKAAKKSAMIKWGKVSKNNKRRIGKIQIQYSLDKTFKKGVKTTTAKKSTTSKKIKKLVSKKTYYIRIRAYKKSSSRIQVSKWSAVKAVRVK